MELYLILFARQQPLQKTSPRNIFYWQALAKTGETAPEDARQKFLPTNRQTNS